MSSFGNTLHGQNALNGLWGASGHTGSSRTNHYCLMSDPSVEAEIALHLVPNPRRAIAESPCFQDRRELLKVSCGNPQEQGAVFRCQRVNSQGAYLFQTHEWIDFSNWFDVGSAGVLLSLNLSPTSSRSKSTVV